MAGGKEVGGNGVAQQTRHWRCDSLQRFLLNRLSARSYQVCLSTFLYKQNVNT